MKSEIMNTPLLTSLPSVKDSAPDALTLHASRSTESSDCIRAQLSVSTTAESTDSDLLHIRASDQTLDRYREVISASGWRLENYQRNPVIQNAHQYGDIIFTIGRAEKTWVSDNALLQTWRFASAQNPFAKIARDLYRGGFLQAASVGFLPIRWEDDPGSTGDSPVRVGDPPTRIRRRYIEQELLEVSAVGIPANPNALMLAYAAGAVEKSDLRELYDLLRHFIRTGSTGDSPVAERDSRSASASDLRDLPIQHPASRNQHHSALESLAAELRSLKKNL